MSKMCFVPALAMSSIHWESALEIATVANKINALCSAIVKNQIKYLKEAETA